MTAKSYWREGAIVWRLGWARLRRRWWVILLVAALGALAVLLQHGWDDRVLHQIRVPETAPNYKTINWFAGRVSYWGDQMWSVPVALLLWAGGAVFRSRRWRRLGWACLWAFLVGSVVVNVFRVPLGRARPSAGVPDGFYGPHLQSNYHGFPSGHSTTSFATAAAVISAAPLLSVPCTLYAATVGWSRMQLNRHHPIDVLTGAALGSVVGLCFGAALPGAGRWRRRMRRR